MAYETILYEVKDGIATITLNRPENFNSLNTQMAEELNSAIIDCEVDEAVRAVVLTGQGKVFCSGGDIKSMLASFDGQRERFFKELVLPFHAFVSGVARLEKPVMGAVNGVAAGAGFSMVMACDIAIASDAARFTMAYTRIGVIPDGGSTYFLSRLLGARRALELIYTNRFLSAEEALQLGIVARVAPETEFAQAAGSLARELADGPTLALGKAKRLVYTGTEESLETQLETERAVISAISRTEDATEGIKAFVEKRSPKFKGR
jgi:2-(1,2-epoxy-1,2-dihydrophenyl)acetyl-CoA isomerase